MAYDKLKEVIDLNIKPNGRQAITGGVLNAVLKEMADELGGATFVGIVQSGGTCTRPEEGSGHYFWLASPTEAGDSPTITVKYGPYYTDEGGALFIGTKGNAGIIEYKEGDGWKVHDDFAFYRLPGYLAGSYLKATTSGYGDFVLQRGGAVSQDVTVLANEGTYSRRELSDPDPRYTVSDRAKIVFRGGTGEYYPQVTDVPTVSGVAKIAGEKVSAEIDRAQAAETELAGKVAEEEARARAAEEQLEVDLGSEAVRATQRENSIAADVAAVNAKIPAQASAENKLADKEFVNSSISTATATFRGTFDNLDALKATAADRNDYAFYVHLDDAGNTCYDKYTYDGAQWAFEYRLNNSSFTAAQWAAINSGATAAEVEKIGATAAEVESVKTALTAEVAARVEADKGLQGGVDAAKAEAGKASAAAAAEKTRAEAAEAELGAGIAALKAGGYQFAGYVSPGGLLVPPAGDGKYFWLADTGDIDTGESCTYSYVGADGQEQTIQLDGGSGGLAVLEYGVDASGIKVNYFKSVVGGMYYNQLAAAYVGLSQIVNDEKQDTLVSGTNIKTVNGTSLLGSGDLEISGGVATMRAGEGANAEVFNGIRPGAATGENSHAEGSLGTQASGFASHAEGSGHASGSYAHAEGFNTTAGGDYSHAEGWTCKAIGWGNHAEGSGNVIASVGASHVEGARNTVSDPDGGNSNSETGVHVEGYGNQVRVTSSGVAKGLHVCGRFAPTISDSSVEWVHGCGSGNTTTRADLAIGNDGEVYIKGVGGWTGENYDFDGVQSLRSVLEDLTARIGALEAK